MKPTTQLIAGALFMLGATFIQAQPAHATVVKNSFLKTQRTISTYNSNKHAKLTLPKGTVVQVKTAALSKKANHLQPLDSRQRLQF
ncbi:hypothetical protein OKF32_04450 [Lentilactobacillus buchneri]|nr:hypothetical protein OKF32_04450 [Lentilactobacillus sp. Egmn17]